MANYGINIGKLFFVGLLSVILTVDVVVGLQALYYWQQNRIEATEDNDPQPAKMKALFERQQAQLTDYRVLDAKKGIVAIPISRAMELVVAELSQHKAGTPQTGELR